MKTHSTNDGAAADSNRQTAGTGQTAQLQTALSTAAADTSAAAAALQRYQQLANDSPQALQLRQRAEMMAAGPAVAQRRRTLSPSSVGGSMIQRFDKTPDLSSMTIQRATGVVQLVWNSVRANAFVNANAPAAGETPSAWKIRIQALLDATDYVNDTDKNVLSTAFARYHQNNYFTAANATAFVLANPPIAGQNEAVYKVAHNVALTAANYIEGISSAYLKSSFNTYHRANVFTAANATTFVAAHPPVRPQIFAAYQVLHNAGLLAAGYDPQISNNILSDAYDAYWVAHPFNAAAAATYFAANPPTNAPQTASDYFYAHMNDLDTNWHAYAALSEPAIIALFLVEMSAFRATQTANKNIVASYYTELGQHSKVHIFNGGFNNGGPKGIHAYRDGALPAGCQIHQTIGGTADVHVIIWSNAASRAVNTCKWSSMFPIQYSQGMVAWYILHHEDAAAYMPGARPTVGIPPWLPIAVGTAGNTEYPIMNNIASTLDVHNAAGGSVDFINHNGHRQYRWNGGPGIRYVIDN